MKTIQKIFKKSLILSLLSLTLLSTNVNAQSTTIDGSKSFYSPERPGVSLITDDGSYHSGFSYATFNNFINNPNIEEGARKGDERIFTLAKYCPQGNCPTGLDNPENVFLNTVTSTLQANDQIRMEIYFHNNGKDPYDYANLAEDTIAKNVKIGIDLNNIQDTENPAILRPKGFIYADNNQYRTEVGILDGVTATDDVQLIKDNDRQSLKLNTEYAYFVYKLDETEGTYYDSQISLTETTNIKIKSINTNETISITITPHIDEANNKLWLHFDKLPGCFRYSGALYFNVIVEEEEEIEEITCESSEILIPTEEIEIENQIGEIIKVETFFKQGEEKTEIPEDTNLVVVSRDPSARFLKASTIDPYYELIDTTRSESSSSITMEDIGEITEFYYFGEGNLSITVKDATEGQNYPLCVDSYTPSIEAPICKEIDINHHYPILENTMSKFNASSYNTDDELFDEQITYTVDDGYGFFTTKECSTYKTNPSDFISQETKSSSTALKKDYVKASLLSLSLSESKAKILEENGIFQKDPSTNVEYIQNKVQTEILKPTEVELDINSKIDLCLGQTEITVDPGTDVYFYAEKESNGQNVIHVRTENTDEEDCGFDFPIQKTPETPTPDVPTCKEMTLTKIDAKINDKEGYSLSPVHTWDPLLLKGDETLEPVTLVWTTTDPNGVFYLKDGDDFIAQGNTISLKSEVFSIVGRGQTHSFKTVYYTGSEIRDRNITVSAVTLDENGNEYSAGCDASFTIPKTPDTLYCESLSIIENKNGRESELQLVQSGQVYQLESYVRYSQTLEDSRSTYSSKSGVFLEVPRISNANQIQTQIILRTYRELANQILEDNLFANYPEKITVYDDQTVFFITRENAENTDTALTVRAEGRSETDCIKTVPLFEELLCLNLDLVEWGNNYVPQVISSVSAGNLYEFVAYIDYSDKEKRKTTYESDYGVFLPVPDSHLEYSDADPMLIKQTILLNSFRNLALNLVDSGYDSRNPNNYPQAVTVTDNTTVFFVTFADAESSDTGLRVYATDRTEEICATTLPIYEIPDDKQCINLSIIKPSGEWNENDLTDRSEQKFEISVETSPSEYAYELKYKWEVDPDSSGDWSKGMYTDSSDANPFINYLENIDEEDEPNVEITAINPETNEILHQCKTDKDYEFTDEEPEIEKYVYDVKAEEWRNTINIGGMTESRTMWLDNDFRYVNYLIEFDPGSAKSAEIWEKQLDNAAIEGSLDGELEYLDMAILVEPDNSNQDPYIIYQSEDFDEDRYLNEKIGSDQFDDYDNHNEDDLDELEDEYHCDYADSDTVCIAQDFEDIERDFKNGKKITFDNLDEADYIYIILQTENFTAITDDRCKELESTEGCGEIFDNTIHFEGSRDNLDEDYDLYDDDYDGDDSAKVIVLCPYIITREGGDVFFTDILDIGVDIEYCSPVEGGGGTTITPEDDNPQTTPSTGSGDEETIVYKVPTHDICKLSNSEDANELEQYKNVLENFSSSICEMEAEVSEEWTEEYITKLINENIEKLSKYGSLYYPVNLYTNNDLAKLENQSVIIVDGFDLTIGDNNNSSFMLNNSAQTFIVKGGGNLIIKNNIKYDDTNVDPLDPKSFPSAAFVAIDGDIKISNNVTEIDGILIGVGDSQIMGLEELPTYDNKLVVKGSLIGNVYDIFFKRRAIGDPLKDEASITVRYDERVLLNTPPGLNELIDLSQLKIAN